MPAKRPERRKFPDKQVVIGGFRPFLDDISCYGVSDRDRERDADGVARFALGKGDRLTVPVYVLKA